MSPQRLSKSRFGVEEDESPKIQKPTASQASKDLGLSQVDSAFAIGQSGGVVVVLQEMHDESAFDTGDFAVSKSRFDKRKDAQKDREEAARRKKEEERRAAIALKKEEEARAAREAEAAKEAARRAAEEEKRRKAQEEREAKKAAKKAAPAPPPPIPEEAKPVKAKPPRKDKKDEALSEGSKAILQDSAVVGIGNVIKKTAPAPPPAAPAVPAPVLVSAGVQTDPVRILPIEQAPSGSSPASASAAWWLQQGHSTAPQAQAAPAAAPSTSSDQFMMQAYIDAMQRQPSNYAYWTTPQSSAADMYWQQQQNVYQTPAQRFGGATAPRRV